MIIYLFFLFLPFRAFVFIYLLLTIQGGLSEKIAHFQIGNEFVTVSNFGWTTVNDTKIVVLRKVQNCSCDQEQIKQ
jgi:hypothetical protein